MPRGIWISTHVLFAFSASSRWPSRSWRLFTTSTLKTTTPETASTTCDVSRASTRPAAFMISRREWPIVAPASGYLVKSAKTATDIWKIEDHLLTVIPTPSPSYLLKQPAYNICTTKQPNHGSIIGFFIHTNCHMNVSLSLGRIVYPLFTVSSVSACSMHMCFPVIRI